MSSKLLSSFLAFTLIAPAVFVEAQVAASHQKHDRQPHTVEYKITTVQTLANGTTITTESKQIQAFDSAGRNMFSRAQLTPVTAAGKNTSGNANDPVANTQSNWSAQSKNATVIQLPPLDQRHGCWADDSGTTRMGWFDSKHPDPHPRPKNVVQTEADRTETKTEELGTSTIQGIEVKGRRITRTIPAGAIGNNQPLVSTEESWLSQGENFGMLVRSVSDNPRMGETTAEITNLTEGEPDPTLFLPPDGYEVKTIELHQIPCQ
jgi:hypothetical protein